VEFEIKLAVRWWLAIGAGVCETSSGGVAASTSGGASPIRIKMGLRGSGLRRGVPVDAIWVLGV
jgi:hypothetical protein